MTVHAIRFAVASALVLTISACSASAPTQRVVGVGSIEVASSDPLPSGPCRVFDELHRLMLEGTLAAGKMDGTWVATGSDGTKVMEWNYRQGVRHGRVKMWYSGMRDRSEAGKPKLEGVMEDGGWVGTVQRTYPSGARQSERVYEHGVLKSNRYWAPNGIEAPPHIAVEEGNFEHEADREYFEFEETTVAHALAEAPREIRR